MSFDIQIINAFADNYIYLTAANGKTVVVDPGDADAVSDSLPAQTALEAILLTHSHADHIGGVRTLMRRFPSAKLYAAEECGFAAARICAEGAQIALLNGALNLATMETPGHTAGHISFYGSGVLFCGDVMFACGCGRLLGGTAAQMQNSLARFAALPADTKVYCGHEYTLANIAFARAADCENKPLCANGKKSPKTCAPADCRQLLSPSPKSWKPIRFCVWIRPPSSPPPAPEIPPPPTKPPFSPPCENGKTIFKKVQQNTE